MSDAIAPLLVPMAVEGLLVNSGVLNEVTFRQWSMAYDNMAAFTDPDPAPFNNVSATAPAPGIHLRWTLPAALTHGTAPATGGPVTFPFAPNRWLVVRYGPSVTPNGPRQTTTWIVQSDYLDATAGSSAFVNPFPANGDIEPTMLGRSMLLGAWEGESGSPQALFLRATGPGNVAFSAYQPGMKDVYSFFDDTTKLATGTVLSYLVAGWYSDPSHDPITGFTTALEWVKGMTALEWSTPGSDSTPPAPLPETLPSQTLLHGLLYDVIWDNATNPPRNDSSASTMQIAVGNTAIDALAAVVAQNATGDSGDSLALRLAAFQYNALAVLDQPDGTAQVELLIRRAWFGTTASGTEWTIVPAQRAEAADHSLQPGVVQPAPAITAAQAQWLAELNRNQLALDESRAALKTLQAQLYATWWMSKRAPFETVQAPPPNLDMGAVQQALAAALSTAPTSVVTQVTTLLAQVNAAAATLPDPTNAASILAFASPMLDPTKLALKPRASVPYFQPTDPVVLIAGVTPPAAAPDTDQPLPVRFTDQAIVGVTVATTPITSSTGLIAGGIPAVGAPTLPPAVSLGIAALNVESYFTDPANAASILSNGLGSTDAPTIAALQKTMTAGAAQIASVSPAIQAPFAYVAWQQPWSPLFMEWDISFEPTVVANPTGQAWNGFQDNWAFDPTSWQFDGSDNVIARGSEYFSFNGSDPWASRTYTGRTFLTPQTTTIMIRRLREYLTAHPDADLHTIEGLIDAIGETRFLSQALSGFTADLGMVSQQQIHPPDSTIASLVGDQYRGAPDVGLGDQDFSFSSGTPFFIPVRGGFISFNRLAIVDAYGQVLDLLLSNGNVGGSPLTFQPIRGRGLVPDSTSTLKAQQQSIKLAPRIVQPSRLDFSFVSATDDTQPTGLYPNANPVCGWFLPNHLDAGISVYDAAGNALGELMRLADAGGTPTLRWLPSPASAFAITDPANIANVHLRGAVTELIALNDGGVAFQNLFQAIDETLWTVEPLGGRGDQDLAALIGRPLALVRAQVSFELAGQPISNLSWMDTLFPQPETAGFTQIPFQIRLGSMELLDDGLTGYFSGDNYATFNAVHSPEGFTPGSGTYLQPIGWNGNYISLPLNYPSYTSQVLTMLIDPRGTVHATTGILPAATLTLDASFFEPALDNMSVTFRAGPVITDPVLVRVPKPAEQHGVWSWVRMIDPNSDYVSDPIIASTQSARLPTPPPHLVDGWLKFVPQTTNEAEP
jgi:hypothetical protein